MADKFTDEQRSRIMSHVKSRDTTPEKLVRSTLHQLGYRFRLQDKKLPGRPDIVLPRHRKIILVHGCFWHGHPQCKRAARPSSNTEFWNAKIDRNIQRDVRVLAKLEALGWHVLVVWQCQTRDKVALQQRLQQFMRNDSTFDMSPTVDTICTQMIETTE